MVNGRLAGYIIKALLIAYLLTGLLVLLAAWITFKLDFNDRAVGFMVVFIYIFVNAVAGLYIGKCIGKRQFLWGMFTGLCYGVILLLVSIIFSGGISNILMDGLCSTLLCAGGGTLGGMIS